MAWRSLAEDVDVVDDAPSIPPGVGKFPGGAHSFATTGEGEPPAAAASLHFAAGQSAMLCPVAQQLPHTCKNLHPLLLHPPGEL